MKRLFFMLLFLGSVLGMNRLKADHVMGADMSYQCLGKGKYKIIVKFYRDCRGAGAPPSWSVLGWFAGANGGNSCGGGNLGGGVIDEGELMSINKTQKLLLF